MRTHCRRWALWLLIQAAACLGVLDELEAVGASTLQARGERLGRRLQALTGLPVVRDVRGLGLLYGVELAAGLLWPLMEEAENRGVFFYPFTGAGKPRSEGLVIAPPLTATDTDIDFMVTGLVDAVTALAESS
ncbi:aminotransferase class III-fold pyridoxal phosphate-dependent enzyme [Streptomyces sp. 1222.5]|uniref:aminotransferase class III-fold pyridoxal phosphate-dependent enzyme n=1 Tax=Streptomyces sp. 1222.5 TaxID=1881026 RepID=UPI003EBA03F0